MRAVHHLYIIGTLCISLMASTTNTYEQGLIVKPMIDLIGLSFCKEYSLKESNAHYKDIPLCAKSGKNGCARLHQLVYNEQVTILEAYEDEVRVEISQLFFQTAQDDTQHIGYWTHKSNVLPFDVLHKKGLDLSLIPQPISFVSHSKTTQDIVTLVEPTYDPITNKTYSAGTRFVRAATASIGKHYVAVHALMPRTLEQVIIGLPKKNVLTEQPNSPAEQQKLFIAILKKWAHTQNGWIPYTWGGCSYTGICTSQEFEIKTRKTPDGVSEYYAWPQVVPPFSGFDCAGIIARATQIAGMPYFYKNTTTLARNMQPLVDGQHIEAGDLIWFSGHVMVVSDVHKNLVIEARGYDHGYGKIQEIKLGKVFEGICTYPQLVQAFLHKTPLKRRNSSGASVQTIPVFKILKMSSIWPDYKYADKH